MKIYRLTAKGKAAARSIRNPDTPEWRVVYFLDQIGNATTDQIISGSRLHYTEIKSALSKLKRIGIIEDIGGRNGISY